MIFDANRFGLGRLLGIAALLATDACADFSRGARSPDTAAGDGGAADTIASAGQDGDAAPSFAHPIHDLLLATCQPCHASGKEAGSTQLLLTGDASADLVTVSRFIDLGAPSSSRLLAKMSGHGHGGGTLYASDAPEYQTVLRWIQEGAPP